MAVDVNQRFQTAAEMRQALLGKHPVASSNIRLWQRLALGCGALVLLAICGAIGYFAWGLVGPNGATPPAATTAVVAAVDTLLPTDTPNSGVNTPAPVSTDNPVADTATPTATPSPTLVIVPTNTPLPEVATSTPEPPPPPTVLPTLPPQPASVVDTNAFKTLGEGYEANGISLALVDYNIESNGNIWLRFTVANHSTKKVLLRYQNSYFSVTDDTSKAYPQDEDFLLDPKQYGLEPDKSFEIDGDSYADRHYEVGLFYGKVPEQANNLIVKVSQFGDLHDMQWRIPLNAQLAVPQTPAPDTQQPPLEGFSANGITMLFSDYNIESNGNIWLKFLACSGTLP
jgi:cytoskeletal protein RodZ